jgi:Barrel-sandwich domain of CusB or HlyD membrane-fusion
VGNVYEKDIATVRVGEPADVSVDAYPGQRWRGRITAIAGAIDPATRTLGIRVVLANPGLRLKPDMFATIRLVRAMRRAIVIPSEAVLREGNENYVFLQQSPGRFVRRPVSLGQEVGSNQVEVTSGISTCGFASDYRDAVQHLCHRYSYLALDLFGGPGGVLRDELDTAETDPDRLQYQAGERHRFQWQSRPPGVVGGPSADSAFCELWHRAAGTALVIHMWRGGG